MGEKSLGNTRCAGWPDLEQACVARQRGLHSTWRGLDQEQRASRVYSPRKLDLSDPKYLHNLKCAECTRELIELRKQRDAQKGFIRDAPRISMSLITLLKI
jgi:hypothetical protein